MEMLGILWASGASRTIAQVYRVLVGIMGTGGIMRHLHRSKRSESGTKYGVLSSAPFYAACVLYCACPVLQPAACFLLELFYSAVQKLVPGLEFVSHSSFTQFYTSSLV